MRYTVSDVKKACTGVLRAAFPNMPVYDNDTVDGYQRPSFFVEILSRGRTSESARVQRFSFAYVITYFEVTHSEADCLAKYESICSAFMPAVRVFQGQRTRVNVRNVSYSWIGENQDMLQITINFHDAIELIAVADDTDLMEHVDINYTETEA